MHLIPNCSEKDSEQLDRGEHGGSFRNGKGLRGAGASARLTPISLLRSFTRSTIAITVLPPSEQR